MAATETYLAQFILWMRGRAFSESSVKTYRNSVQRFFGYLGERGIENIRDVTPPIVSQYQVYISTQPGPKKKKLSLSTQHLHITCLKTFFRAVVREGKLLFDPSSHIEFPRVRRNLPKDIFTFKETDALLNAPNPERHIELRDKAILELFYSSGLRNSELRNLEIRDVDLQERLVRIRHAKADKERVVPVGRVAASYIEEYLREVRPKLLNGEPTEVLFLSIRGRRLDQSLPAYIVQKYAKRAKITKRVNAHTMRHTCATHLLRCKAPLRYIQELLGHTSLNTTQIYTQVEPIDLKRIHAQTHPREKGFPDAEMG